MTTKMSSISKIKKVDFTNYRYEFSKGLFLIEYDLQYNDGTYHTWEIKDLVNCNDLFELNNKALKTMNKSFLRVKEWLKENHPEFFI